MLLKEKLQISFLVENHRKLVVVLTVLAPIELLLHFVESHHRMLVATIDLVVLVKLLFLSWY
jgi:hypothetical protein